MRKIRDKLFGTPVDPLDMESALEELDASVRERRKVSVSFLNAGKMAAMDKDSELKKAVDESDLILADGKSVVWSASLLGVNLPERVAGIDLMMELLKRGPDKGYRFFFLGAKESVLEEAIKKAEEKFPGVNVVGKQNGYFDSGEEEKIVEEINAFSADILFIAMSSPKKEIFLAKWAEKLNVPVVMGVGGSFDVLAGVTARAPKFMQDIGLEWLYRLIQEPGRMWKRYLVGNSLFILKTLRCLFRNCECCGRIGEDGKTSKSSNINRLVGALFVFLFVKSLLFAFVTPPWMGNDEPNHFEYVLLMSGSGSGKSNQEAIIESLNKTEFWEKAEMKSPPENAKFFRDTDLRNHSEEVSGSRPPLYYLIAGMPLRIFSVSGMENRLLLSRLVSVFFSMLTFFVIYKSAQNVFLGGHRNSGSVSSLMLAGLHPQLSYQSVMVNSDVLLVFFFSFFFYLFTLFIKNASFGAKEIFASVVALCFAILTKQHGLILFPILLLGVGFVGREGLGLASLAKNALQRWMFMALLLLGAVLALEYVAPIAVIKLADRISMTLGYFHSSSEAAQKMGLSQWLRGFGIMFVTFWLTYGQMVHKMSFGFYFVFGVFSLAVFFGVFYGLWRLLKKEGPEVARLKSLVFSVMFLLVILGVTIFVFFDPKWIHRVSGRYLFYSAAPASLLAAFGIASLQDKIRSFDLQKSVLIFFLILNVISLYGYMIPAYQR